MVYILDVSVQGVGALLHFVLIAKFVVLVELVRVIVEG
jgi:hypothetical protein